MSTPLRILLVDDNPQDRALIRRVLDRDLDVTEIVEVGSREELHSALRRFKPDVAILDYALRWGTGLEVMKDVSERFPECIVVMYTGTGDEEVAVEGLRAGLDDYVVKSQVGLEKLAPTISNALRRRRDRKRVELLEGRLRRLLDHLPVGVYRSTPSGQILWANQRFLDMTGYDSLQELRDIRAEDLYVDEREREAFLAQLTATRSATHEATMRRRDDSELWVRDRARLVSPADGSGPLVEGFIEDVSERRRAEDDVQRHHAFISLLQSVTATANRSNRLAEALEEVWPEICAGYGWAVGHVYKVSGDEVPTLKPTHIEYRESAAFEPFIAATRSRTFEEGEGLPGRVLSGRTPVVIGDVREAPDFVRRAAAESVGISTALGVPIVVGKRVVGVLELYAASPKQVDDEYLDIIGQVAAQLGRVAEREEAETRRRNLEGHLRTKAKLEAVGRLAGGVAHDFNNLLAAISAEAELALMESPDAAVEESLRSIGRTVGRARDLTTQLTAFSRGEDETTGDPEPLDTGDAIRDILRMLERLVGARIRVDVEIGDGPLVVRAARSQFEQVLVNLVVNARDAMPDGGRIVVRTRRVDLSQGVDPVLSGPHVLVEVSDEGRGMPPEVLERVFEPFFTTKSDGTGLGLATSYGIVRGIGGRLRAYSEPGVGTTMRAMLPAAGPAVGEKRFDAPSAEEAPVVGGDERLLVVEDLPGLLRAARDVLAGLGYDVRTAATVEEALNSLDGGESNPRLLFTDVALPDGRGTELAREMRRRIPDLRVVLTTGYANVVQGDRDVADDLVLKPYSMPDVARRIRRLLDEESVQPHG